MVLRTLRYLHGWLFTINASRYDGERRKKVVRYQEECYEVLCSYFTDGGAINPEASNSQ
jgi:hypothetical protein